MIHLQIFKIKSKSLTAFYLTYLGPPLFSNIISKDNISLVAPSTLLSANIYNIDNSIYQLVIVTRFSSILQALVRYEQKSCLYSGTGQNKPSESE